MMARTRVVGHAASMARSSIIGTLPSEYLKATSIDKDIETQIYQMSLWHKKFADLLNIVVIVKTNLKTNKTAHVVLFSSDLDVGV